MSTADAQSNGEETAGGRSYEEVLQSVGLGLKCMRESLQQQCQDAQHQLEKRLQEVLYRQEQKLQNDFRQQLQEVQRHHDRRLQEALRQQELSLQHDFRKLLKDSVSLIQQKMRGTSHGVPDDAKPTRDRQALELVAELLEEAHLRAEQSYPSSPGGRGRQENLEARMQKLEYSMEKALGDVFPRVDALLTRLDEPRHPLTPTSLSFISNFSSTSSAQSGPPNTNCVPSTSDIALSDSSNRNLSKPSDSFSDIATSSTSNLASSTTELTLQPITSVAPISVPTSSSVISTFASNSNSTSNTTSDNSASDSFRVIPTPTSLNTTFGTSASNSSLPHYSTSNSNADPLRTSILNSSISPTTATTSPVSYTTSSPTTLVHSSSTHPSSTSIPTCSISSTSTSFVSITKSSFTPISTPSTSSTSNTSTPYSSMSTSCPESPVSHSRSSATALQANDNSPTDGVELMNEFGEAVLDGRMADARRLLNEGVSSFLSWVKM